MNVEKLNKIVSEDACYMPAANQFAAYYEVKPYLVIGGQRYFGPTNEVVLTAETTKALTWHLVRRCCTIIKRTPLEKYGIGDALNGGNFRFGIKLSWGSRSAHLEWVPTARKIPA